MFALRALLNSLAPLIGAEMESGKAVSPDWASSASNEKIDEWRQHATSAIKDEMETVFQEICSTENGLLMRKVGVNSRMFISPPRLTYFAETWSSSFSYYR